MLQMGTEYNATQTLTSLLEFLSLWTSLNYRALSNIQNRLTNHFMMLT
jgi:hypothetical protein